MEEHLNITIQQVDSDMKVPHDDFDGKVVYGQKRKFAGTDYETHTEQMAPVVKELCDLESKAQLYYIKNYLMGLKR